MKKLLKYFFIFLAVLLLISISFANGRISTEEDIDKI
jgi:hypothetical protein